MTCACLTGRGLLLQPRAGSGPAWQSGLHVIHQLVEERAGAHGGGGEGGVRLVVAADVHRLALARQQLPHNLLLAGGQRGRELGEQLRLLLRQRLRPVLGDVEVGAAVVQLAALAARRLAVVQHAGHGSHEAGAKRGGRGVVGAGRQLLKRDGRGEVLAQAVPPQVALLHKLLHVLGRRAARPRLQQAAARQQRHDGQHLGAGAELNDGEEVRQVVAQHVAGHADGVEAGARAGAALLHRRHRVRKRDVQAGGVVLREVLGAQRNQLRVVRALGVQPEDSLGATGARAGDGQLDPVTDGGVLGLAHAPDVARFHRVLKQELAAAVNTHFHLAGRRDLKRLVMAAVLLRLLGHQAHIGDVPHGRHVKLAVLFAVVQHRGVDAGVAAVGDHALDVLQHVVLVPHLAAVAHHAGHGGVDDDVAGHVQVGDALGAVHHGQARPARGAVDRRQRRLHLRLLRVAGELFVDVAQAVVGVHMELLQQRAVLVPHLLEVHLHAVPKHDGVRHLHHRRLHVQRRHEALGGAVRQLRLEERAQRGCRHARGVDHLARLQLDALPQHAAAAVGAHQRRAH
mmetsp:Transcript_13231/g.33990  ORF Transcript_13231/g.33990 Transcript_13231/m.33990 type:complete len:569 (+) Transcript_13231:365-2071(+)